MIVQIKTLMANWEKDASFGGDTDTPRFQQIFPFHLGEHFPVVLDTGDWGVERENSPHHILFRFQCILIFWLKSYSLNMPLVHNQYIHRHSYKQTNTNTYFGAMYQVELHKQVLLITRRLQAHVIFWHCFATAIAFFIDFACFPVVLGFPTASYTSTNQIQCCLTF